MSNNDSRLYKFHVFALLALTTLLFSYFEAYLPVGPELLQNADFELGLKNWQRGPAKEAAVLLGGGKVLLLSTDSSKFIHITQKISDPQKYRLLRLSGEIRTRQVKAGKKDWQKARLILSSHDSKGQWLPASHHVALLTGSKPWRHYAEVFKLIPEAEELQVSVQLPMATGTMWAKNLSLREVVERPSYTVGKWVGIVCWSLFLFWLLLPHLAAPNIVKRIAILLTVVAVFVGTMTTGDQQHKIQKDSYVTLQKMTTEKSTQEINSDYQHYQIEQQVDKKKLDITKLGHFMVFALLALCLSITFPAVGQKYLLIDISMLAGATEFLQFFIEGRTPLFNDWLIDTSGAILGLGLVFTWKRFRGAEGQNNESSTA